MTKAAMCRRTRVALFLRRGIFRSTGFLIFEFSVLSSLPVGKRAAFRLSASHTGARMEPATPAHDILAATLIALVSIFASVLGISGLKRRARKFAKNAPTKAR